MGLDQKIFIGLNVLDVIAMAWFTLCWVGYTFYSEKKASNTNCLSNSLNQHRILWMQNMLGRENRVADASLLANLERNVAFFASSTLLILAGIITLLGSLDKLVDVAELLPFSTATARHAWEVKLLLLAGIFIYAFFKFTWSLRQYGFACVVVGSAPLKASAADANALSEHAAKIISRAAHAFNLGLRAYYFSLAYLVWFVHPWMFMLTTTWVVGVLYRREFKSKVLRALVRASKAS